MLGQKTVEDFPPNEVTNRASALVMAPFQCACPIHKNIVFGDQSASRRKRLFASQNYSHGCADTHEAFDLAISQPCVFDQRFPRDLAFGMPISQHVEEASELVKFQQVTIANLKFLYPFCQKVPSAWSES